jgi:ATP-dependent Lhr-like helicase
MLVVTPTRALGNDLCRRITRPLAELGLSLGRWTGEHKEPGSRHQGGGLPDVTIVTPESLDSLISRGPKRLRQVEHLFIDELHILAGTARGSQLRMLLGRLRHLSESPVQIAAASATVADPTEMASHYLRDALLLQESRRHVVSARLVHGASPPVVAHTLAELCREGRTDKVLLFANRRDQVERYATELRSLPAFEGNVFPHHGSLSRAFRESVEERFLAAPRGLCVATMTLELGIDIGDVDLVGLLGPPPNVSSMLQRVGRSGRRGVPPRAICFGDNEARLFRFRLLLELAAEGDLAEDPAGFHPSVLVQQALSLLHQNRGRWVSATALHSRMDEALAAQWPRERLERLLQHLAKTGELLESSGKGRFVATEKCEQRWRRGSLHSNIADQGGLEVVDQLTGAVIGTVAKGELGGSMKIGGRSRKVVAADWDRVVVGGAVASRAPRFATQGVTLVSRALARATGRRLGVMPNHWPMVHLDDGEVALFHFGGTAWGLLVAAALARRKTSPEASVSPLETHRVGPFGLTTQAAQLARVPRLAVEDLRALVSERRASLAQVVAMGPYHRYLPDEEYDSALFDALAVEALATELERAELGPPPNEVPQELWTGLL